MAKPTEEYRWAYGASPNISTPDTPTFEGGWQFEQIPPSGWQNYHMNAVGKWIAYLEQFTDSLSSDDIANNSSQPGATVSDALDNLVSSSAVQYDLTGRGGTVDRLKIVLTTSLLPNYSVANFNCISKDIKTLAGDSMGAIETSGVYSGAFLGTPTGITDGQTGVVVYEDSANPGVMVSAACYYDAGNNQISFNATSGLTLDIHSITMSWFEEVAA